MQLTNRVVLITGGKRIGATVAIQLARRGADVALSYNRSESEALETAEAVRALGRRAIVRQANLSDPEACARLVAGVAGELGGLDVLVHMASIYEATPFAELAVEDLQVCLDVEVKAGLALSLGAASFMAPRGGGRIILFSDWLAVSDRPRYKGYLPYYVAKKAVMGLTEALALELADDRTLVNAVAPGPILAPPGVTEEEYEAVEKATPLGQWGGGEEIAKVVISLIETDFITGETIRVDGGRHVR